MKSAPQIRLWTVQQVYAGPEGRIWELLMGDQIHIGGLQSTAELATRANIKPGQKGVDLCCGNGAGMRALIRFYEVAHMTGVDATPNMLEIARTRAREENLLEKLTLILGEATQTGLPANSFDFVWGEDAWCYVEDKPKLISEALRLLKPGGIIAFTDWMEGPNEMTNEEADRFLAFMKFPSILTLEEYRVLLKATGAKVEFAENTGRFANFAPIYLELASKQFKYDILRLLNFNEKFYDALINDLRFTAELAASGKIMQGMIIARKPKT